LLLSDIKEQDSILEDIINMFNKEQHKDSKKERSKDSLDSMKHAFDDANETIKKIDELSEQVSTQIKNICGDDSFTLSK
jgi:hypothetical protein